MEDIILLSEIHPLGFDLPLPFWNPLVQAYYWHKIITPENIQAKKYYFLEAIQLIEKKCTVKQKKLVIRDWASFDFTANPFSEEPAHFKFLLHELLSEHFEIIEVGLVRTTR